MADLTTDSSPQTRLGLFAKVWDPGKVKTRLAKTLGDETASRIYVELLKLHLMRFASSSKVRSVVYSPADEHSRNRFEKLIDSMTPRIDWELTPQVESDLGTRMSTFFQQQFDASNESARVVVIGSDAPRLTAEMVDEAFELLVSNDVVFGPSTDGGYYLIGLSVMNRHIFTDVQWSTEMVLQQSLARCREANLQVAQLRPLTDIDEEEDLMHELDQLQQFEDDHSKAFLDGIAAHLRRVQR